MGTRGHGTYAKLFRDVWTHPKTYRLAAALAKDLGVPEPFSVSVAVGQFHQLLCWCIADQDDGQVGHLPATAFARVVGWHDPTTATTLWQAWMGSGFLDVHGPGDVVVHDLCEAAADLMRKRAARRLPDGSRPPRGRPPKAPDRATPEIRAESGRPDYQEKRAESGRNPAALARAFGSGSGSGRTHTPPDPPAADGADAPESVCVDKKSRAAEPTAEANTRPQDAPESDPLQPDEDDRVRKTWAAWLAGCRFRRVRPPKWSEDARQALDDLIDASGENVTIACSVIERYFGSTDPYLRDAGWSMRVFPYRVPALVAKTVEAYEKAERDQAARDAARRKQEEEAAEPTVDPARIRELVATLRKGVPAAPTNGKDHP